MLFSTLVHLILGFLLFVVYKEEAASFRVEIGRGHAPTLFVSSKRPAGRCHRRSLPVGHAHVGGACKDIKSKKDGATGSLSGGYGKHGGLEKTREKGESNIKLGSTTTMGWWSPSKQHDLAGNMYVPVKGQAKKAKKVARAGKKKQMPEKPLPVHKEVVKCIHSPKVIKPSKPAIKKDTVADHPKISKPETPLPVEQKTVEDSLKSAYKEQAVIPDVKDVSTPHVQPEIEQEDNVDLHSSEQVPDPVDQQNSEAVQEVLEPTAAGDYGLDEITIGQNYNGEYITAEQARIYECVEQEIVSKWRPPRGLSKDLVCQVKCSIGGDGTVVTCNIEKGSGVLIYDMAARSAARMINLPRWAWGKDFTIIFKQ